MKAVRNICGAAAVILIAASGGLAVAQNKGQGITKTEIVIGTHTDLSGVAAAFGVHSSNAARMRFDEVNAAGGIHGRMIRYIVEDSQYQVPRAVQAANKLLHRDKVFLILLGAGTPMNNAVLPEQIKLGVPNFFPLSWARQLYEPFHPMKWAAGASYYAQMRSAMRYFVQERGKKNICALYQDTDFGREVFEGVKDQLAAMNVKLADSTTHKPTDTDFTAHLTKLRASGCDLIALGSIIRDSILPVSTAKKMGWDVDMVGTTATFDLAVASAPGGATEGLYAMTQIEAPYRDSSNAALQQWVEKYREKYGADPNPAAQFSYVAADLIVMGLDRAGKDLTLESFLKAMESIQGYRDIFGGPVMTFGPNKHHGTDAVFMAQVKNGRWQRVTEPLAF
ncbi:ABC transporter substrate-binding protein [uncultured Ferrovibrio sp.]|jgi:branched-chain amino acid transport system substrate-binding protein|uniref:ABC transporter substrate-binding protein n=1 Tax=uncultured Ferrovibrio sp. TaxID=1576913 RepID=UPI002639B282|nr:ABC transporter substrate-binding protein [uncultured Ferrovibrio sp.]